MVDILREKIAELAYLESDQIKPDDNIFESGYLDSMGFLTLVDFLKTTFMIEINDKDLIEDNFKTINKIINYVKSIAT